MVKSPPVAKSQCSSQPPEPGSEGDDPSASGGVRTPDGPIRPKPGISGNSLTVKGLREPDWSHLKFYGYRYLDPMTGRWPSRDPIGEQGGINLYGFVGNDGVNDWDVLGEYIFSDEGEGLRGKVKDALQKLAGGKLRWCKLSESEILMPSVAGVDKDKVYVLLKDEDGSGEMWDAISSLFSEDPTIILILSEIETNGGGARSGSPRRLVLPENPKIKIPVESGGKDAEGDPIYELKDQSFESLLWHELVGHIIKEYDHPKQRWNTYSYKGTKFTKQTQALWERGDEAVGEENRARKLLGEPLRRPQYWDKKEDWR